jgi:hypothetical protein
VVASVGNGQAGVTWTAAASNGSPITGYTVTSAPGGFTSSVGNVTNATVTGLTNGTAYTFTVTATNSVGTGPASAASNSVTPTGPPSAPTNVVATRGDTQAAVTWTAALANGSPITGYTVTSAPGGITSSVGNVTNATVTGLTNGTAYTFTVTATNSVGTGPSSAASNSVTPAGLPSAPTNVVATPGNGQAGVTWTAAPANGSPITGYTVTSAPGGITSSVGNVTNATVTGLTNGTTYTFTVTATNGVGTGAASAASNAVTPSGSGTISNLHVFDTTNASNWSIQSNLQLGAQGWGDRTYTLPTIPSALLGAQYIRPAMASKTSTQNPLVSFSISSQMTVYVAVDVRRGRPTWMASWADTGTQIVDSESTPTHLEVFSMTFAAGTVSLGPNVGTGSSYVQYLVIAR